MITGGCLCKAVRFEIDAEPLTVRTCWCRLCQYLGAGSATVNVTFPADKVRMTAELRYRQDVADSGNVLQRGFCPSCGTPLTSAAEARPHLLIVRVGTLDDPNQFAPEVTIWTSEAPHWAVISDEIPSHPAQIPQPPA